MMPDVYHVPFPVALHGGSVDASLAAIDKLFKADLDPARVAAIILEPVQGEGGFYPAPAELMRAIRKLCDTHGIVMIADEVQTGFGRTGALFAMEAYDVAADLTTMAKGLGGGLPISAVTGRADLMDAAGVGGLGGTYGGNPLGVGGRQRGARRDRGGKPLRPGERTGRAAAPAAGDAPREHTADRRRARPGMMVAAEFNTEDGQTPDADFANRVRLEALQRGLILLTCGVYGNVIRFLAPLTIEDAVFAEALDILDAAVAAAKGA